MPKEYTTNGDTSRLERAVLSDTSGVPMTGLDETTPGLIIAAIADVEVVGLVYTQAAGNIETISTLGTYAVPTTGKCRLKEVHATNHPGVYEIQLADERYAVSNAEKLIITISGVTDQIPTHIENQLGVFDPYGTQIELTDIWSDGVAPIGQNVIDALTSAMIRAVSGIALATVNTGATTTSITTSSLLPAAIAANQFKGRVMTFADDTATTELRGQTTVITANTSGGTFTVVALTTAPASGDIATIQ